MNHMITLWQKYLEEKLWKMWLTVETNQQMIALVVVVVVVVVVTVVMKTPAAAIVNELTILLFCELFHFVSKK